MTIKRFNLSRTFKLFGNFPAGYSLDNLVPRVLSFHGHVTRALSLQVTGRRGPWELGCSSRPQSLLFEGPAG